MAAIGEKFRPGGKVPDSGIYDVVHDQHHRPNHQVVCTRGQVFYTCRTCGEGVRFELAIKAPFIGDDLDFGSPKEKPRILKPAA